MVDINTLPKGAQIKTLAKYFKNTLRKYSNDEGLNATYCDIIMFLAKHGSASQNEIVERTRLSKPTISLTLKNMESIGYINRVQSENDSRMVNVQLTDLGKEYDKKIQGVFKKVENKMIEGLSENELNLFSVLINKMFENLYIEGGNI